MRLIPEVPFFAAIVLALAPRASVAEPAAPAAAPPADDPLGNIVVVAGGSRPLPKIAVLPSVAADVEDVTAHTVMRRDLDLSGEFDLLADSAAPDGLYMADAPVDVAAWSKKGAEALVKVSGKPRDKDTAELRAQVFLTARGTTPVFDKRYRVRASELRAESHRLADRVIGALTGQSGGFASHFTFATGAAGVRQVVTMDADGHDARAVSPPGKSAIAPAFGKNGSLFFAAAAPGELYRVYDGTGAAVPIPYKASVYGIAFSRDRSQVAVALGLRDSIKIFSGPDFASLKPASDVGMATHPTFTPEGKLAFAGEGTSGQRIFVDGKPVTPDGLFASSPTFCNNPDGVRLVFAVGVGKDTDLVVTGEHGGPLLRLTQGQARNSYPACSPDGRLVAFVSTRASGEGPGIYVARIDGQGRAKKVAPILGDSLRWDPLPASTAHEITDGP